MTVKICVESPFKFSGISRIIIIFQLTRQLRIDKTRGPLYQVNIRPKTEILLRLIRIDQCFPNLRNETRISLRLTKSPDH